MQDIEVYDLYDVWYQPWWQSTTAKYAVLVVVILLFLGLVWFLMKWLRKTQPMPYDQKILMQCQQLKKNSALFEMPFLYAELTALLKEYLAKRYNAHLASLTDQELLAHIGELGMQEAQIASVQKLLLYSVPAKFDDHQTALEDPVIHIMLLEQLIKETQSQNQPPS